MYLKAFTKYFLNKSISVAKCDNEVEIFGFLFVFKKINNPDEYVM